MSELTTPGVIVCAVCGKSVNLGTASANETGLPVHAECYLEQLLERQTARLRLLGRLGIVSESS